MHTKKQQMTGSSWSAGLRHRGQSLLILLSLFGYWQTCQAADFTCTTPGDVQCLIAAITAANANGQVNTITLVAGTYTLTAIHNGTTPDTNGLPVITSTLTIMGAGAATTSIERAASAPAFRLLKVAATGTLTLQGLTLRGGNSPSSGGGIYNLGALTLTDCSLTANQAPGHGGGIANGGVIGGIFYNGGTVTLTNCALTNNNGSGGGIANVGGTMTVANSSLAYNSGNLGGGIYNINNSTLTLTNCSLTNNTANGGGGLFNDRSTVTLTNGILTDNDGGGAGGGIWNNTYVTMTLTNCSLTNNTANSGGGMGSGEQRNKKPV